MAAAPRPLVPALRPEVALELRPHGVQRGEEGVVRGRLLELLLGDQAEHAYRALPGGDPRVVVQPHEEHDGLVVPADPQVVRQLLERFQALGECWA